MFNNYTKEKFKTILKFVFASLKVSLSSIFFGFIGLIIIAVTGMYISGDWTIGISFSEWWGDMTSQPIIDGKFSAVDFSTCWSCGIFAKLFDLLSMTALNMYVYISDIAWTLIVFGFAVWLLIYMYDGIIHQKVQDAATMLKDVAKRVIIISIVGVAINIPSTTGLKNMATTIFDATAVPILKMGIGVGEKIIDSPVCENLYYPTTEVDGIISPELKNDMLCLMNSVNAVFLSAMTAGSNMISMSWKNFISDMSKNAKYLPDVIAGMAIIIIFFLMYLSIPFVLIDIIFTVGILFSFLPLFIGGYAYDKTKGFASNGITSLFGMSFYIIMYCIFLGIIYSSFIYIADMYYPAPLDNFTYLFPDFIYANMTSGNAEILTSQTVDIAAAQTCLAKGEISEIQSCLLPLGIEFEMPSLENPGGAFLPMFTFGLFSLMIMGNLKTYTGIISGYMFEFGKPAKAFLLSTWNWASNGVKREFSNFMQEKEISNKFLNNKKPSNKKEEKNINKKEDEIIKAAEDIS